MASKHQNDGNDLAYKYQDEEFNALKKEEREKLSREEYEIVKNAGFHFNYENGVKSFLHVKSSQDHTVMFEPPSNQKDGKDQWNDNYVKLPFSEYNRDKNGTNRWPIIKKSLNTLAKLLQKDPDSSHIQEQIKIYKRSKYFNCGSLNYIFQEELEGKKGEKLLRELIPKIVDLALDLPNLILKPIPILKLGKSHSISLTQHQCASLLANSFFCTFPDRGNDNPENMPYINMDGLHKGEGMKSKVEKLKCILHYFQRVTDKMPDGVLTFSRICIAENNFPSFKNSNKPIRKPLVRSKGTIEDCKGALQVDFANKYIGGGVLNHGCVQEEIRFVICPELLVSLLFSERMGSNEAILIRGAERFSSYTGYASSFEWLEDYVDDTARDEDKRRYTDIVAIDALKYRYLKVQFEEKNINRELRKSYVGFASQVLGQRHPLIATGNWGCGAFGGDKQLKFLIQLMSASQADRDLVFYTFNEKNTKKNLNELYEIIESNKLTVSELYKRIVHYYDEIAKISHRDLSEFNLLEYLKATYSNEKKDCSCS